MRQLDPRVGCMISGIAVRKLLVNLYIFVQYSSVNRSQTQMGVLNSKINHLPRNELLD
jgi:hypothetical protein